MKIFYTGIGANKNGIHTPEEFLYIMNRDLCNNDWEVLLSCATREEIIQLNFKNWNLPSGFIHFTLDDWIEYSGASICREKNDVLICNYCHSEGHLLKECTNESIFKIDDELKNISILDYFFSSCLFLFNEIRSFSIQKIKVLGNLHNVKHSQNAIIRIYRRNADKFMAYLIKNLSNETFYYFIEDFYSFILYFKEKNKLLNFNRNNILTQILTRLYDLSVKCNLIYKLNTKYYILHEKIKFTSEFENKECPICYEKISEENIIFTECSHAYCYDCIHNYFEVIENIRQIPSCCYCRKKLSLFKYCDSTGFRKLKMKYLLPNLVVKII